VTSVVMETKLDDASSHVRSNSSQQHGDSKVASASSQQSQSGASTTTALSSSHSGHSSQSLPLTLQKYPPLLKTIESLRPLSQNNSFSSLKRISLAKCARTERSNAIERRDLLDLLFCWLKRGGDASSGGAAGSSAAAVNGTVANSSSVGNSDASNQTEELRRKLERVADVMQKEVGYPLGGMLWDLERRDDTDTTRASNNLKKSIRLAGEEDSLKPTEQTPTKGDLLLRGRHISSQSSSVSSSPDSLLKKLLVFAMDPQDSQDPLTIPKSAREERKRAQDMEVQTASIYNYVAEKGLEEQVETHIWDEGFDEPGINVIFGKDGKSLHAATLNKLVEGITDTAVNNDYRNTFMETYRSFTSPETILRKLFERYNVPTHVNQQTKNIVKTRVTQLLKLWIKDYFFDWNESMLRSLEKFMDDHLKEEYPRFISALQANCDRLRRGEVQKMTSIGSNSVQKPLISLEQLLHLDTMDIYSIEPEEIARQMTIVEHRIYKRIRSTELLNQAWNNKSLRHRSPNVLKLIHRFNQISKWVSSEMVQPESLAKRIERYEFFIRIAEMLREPLHNYNAMLAICSGLQNASVNRMRHTKRGVAEESLESLKEMLDMTSTDDSYKVFRGILKSAAPPKLPYLGMFLTDITFIEDGNSDFIDSEVPGKVLINWTKRCMVYRVIKQIRDFQNYDYTAYHAPVHQVQNLIEKSINSDSVMTGDELFALSQNREPKKSKLSKITP